MSKMNNNKSIIFVFSILICLTIGKITTSCFLSNEKEAFLELSGNSELSSDSLNNFIQFFTSIVKDSSIRETAFKQCNSKLKEVLERRLIQLDEYISFRTEITNKDSTVSVLFYDESLMFYKCRFSKFEKKWFLQSVDKYMNIKQNKILKSLQLRKNRIIFNLPCLDKKFVGLINEYGTTNTIYKAKNILKYAFSNSYIFYNENSELGDDFEYLFYGLGTGINSLAKFKNNCLVKYVDASN